MKKRRGESAGEVCRKIAKDIERWFKKEKIRCDKCNGAVKLETLPIDNIEIEPIRVVCKKCRYMFFEPLTVKYAINAIKLAYSTNKKVREELIRFLKIGMNRGYYLTKTGYSSIK